MAQVLLEIGGRTHPIGCRDGEEARVRQLGRLIDERWPAALRAAGNQPGERAMLFVALMLADSLDECEQRPPVGAAIGDAALARIADRLESLASALEQTAKAT
jgi:cell division protein ZapA